jgi:hypothetical protein
MKHYLMTRDEHFARAIGVQAAHKAEQSAHAGSSREQNAEGPARKKARSLLGAALSWATLQTPRMEDRGLEPLTFWLPARRSPN